jgi:DNA-binding NarL/FixJ family response regulator
MGEDHNGAMPNGLTPREVEILKLRAHGWTNKEIAESLGISVKTVDAHRANMMTKLRLNRNRDLIDFAIQDNLLKT